MKRVLLFLMAFAGIGSANAQITFYDYSPDEELHATYAGEAINIDFDNDQNPELTLYGTKHDTVIAGVFSTTLTGFAISTYSNTEILGRTTTLQSETILEADTLVTGFSIDGAATYVSSASPSIFPGVGLTAIEQSTSSTVGQFAGAGDMYIGVKFDISGATHYGWIKVNVSSTHDTCIVDAYAYEGTASTAIIAGDTGNGVLSVEEEELTVSVVALENSFKVSGLTSGVVTIYNVLGEVEFSKRTASDVEFIDNTRLSSGVYLVACVSGSKRVTYKVFKP